MGLVSEHSGGGGTELRDAALGGASDFFCMQIVAMSAQLLRIHPRMSHGQSLH